MVGAILTQNTAWTNVEKAILNLRKEKLLSYRAMRKATEEKLALAIKPAGYFNIKARRLKNFMSFLGQDSRGNFKKLFSGDIVGLRQKFLEVNGIGPETADSILLYAGQKPVFVVDAYTRRVFSRIGVLSKNASYDEIQRFFMMNLDQNASFYN